VNPVLVVFDLESNDAPFPLGVCIAVEEDQIRYLDAQGRYRYAPCDCVQIVPVDVLARAEA
jgi:hypothetical protein